MTEWGMLLLCRVHRARSDGSAHVASGGRCRPRPDGHRDRGGHGQLLDHDPDRTSTSDRSTRPCTRPATRPVTARRAPRICPACRPPRTATPITAPAPPRPAVAEAEVERNCCAVPRRRSESQGPDDQVPRRAGRRRTRLRGARRLPGLVGQRQLAFSRWRPCSFRWFFGSGRTSRRPSCCRGAILIEQGIQFPHIPITEKIPLWQGIGPGHLQGADILLLIVLVIYLLKRKELGARWFPRTHVSVAMRAVLACVALAIVVGHVHHGSLRVSLMEARPYVYLAATYFLTCRLRPGSQGDTRGALGVCRSRRVQSSAGHLRLDRQPAPGSEAESLHRSRGLVLLRDLHVPRAGALAVRPEREASHLGDVAAAPGALGEHRERSAGLPGRCWPADCSASV